MSYKYTMLFGYQSNRTGVSPLPARVAGMTEGFYRGDDTPQPGLFDALCSNRSQMLPVGCSIIGQRIQRVLPNGPVTSNSKFWPGMGSIGGAADIPQMALRASFVATDGLNKITRLLHMIPDICVKEGELVPTNAWAEALRYFQLQLIDKAWRFRSVDKTNLNVPLVSISAIGEAISITPHGLVAGNEVIVTRAKSSTGKTYKLTGRVVSAADATHFVMTGAAGFALTGGYSRRKTTVLPIINGVFPGRVTTRKVGRPSDAYRGRR